MPLIVSCNSNSLYSQSPYCYLRRGPQTGQTPACPGWPILCRSSWPRCPQASDPNTSPHPGRRTGSASGSGYHRRHAPELCGAGWIEEGRRERRRREERGGHFNENQMHGRERGRGEERKRCWSWKWKKWIIKSWNRPEYQWERREETRNSERQMDRGRKVGRVWKRGRERKER